MELKVSHDSTTLGDLIAKGADGATAMPLASLADLVRNVMARGTTPRVPAVLEVARVLRSAAPAPELFSTVPGNYAAPLKSGHVFRAGVAEKSAQLVPKRQRGFSATQWGGGASGFDMKPAVKGCPALVGLDGALTLIEAAWAQGKDADKWMKQGPLACLAIRLDVANTLFGFGPERSFWESEPTPAPGTALTEDQQRQPHALTFLSSHDGAKWGHNFTNEPHPRRLIRLADVVQAAVPAGRAHAAGMPLKNAVDWVLDALVTARTLQWFLLDPVGEPRELDDGDIAHASEPGNARAFLIDDDDAKNWQEFDPKPTGILEALRAVWCLNLRDAGGLDDEPLARLAIPVELVAALPWIQAKAERPALALVSVSGIDGQDSRIVQPAGSQWSDHKKGDKWSEDEKVAMREMRNNGMTDAEIATVAGCTRQVVGQQIGSKQAERAKQARARINGQLQA